MCYQNIRSASFSFVTIHASDRRTRRTDRQNSDSNTVRCIRCSRTVKTHHISSRLCILIVKTGSFCNWYIHKIQNVIAFYPNVTWRSGLCCRNSVRPSVCLSFITLVQCTVLRGLKLSAIFLHRCVLWPSIDLRAKFYGYRPRDGAGAERGAGASGNGNGAVSGLNWPLKFPSKVICYWNFVMLYKLYLSHVKNELSIGILVPIGIFCFWIPNFVFDVFVWTGNTLRQHTTVQWSNFTRHFFTI